MSRKKSGEGKTLPQRLIGSVSHGRIHQLRRRPYAAPAHLGDRTAAGRRTAVGGLRRGNVHHVPGGRAVRGEPRRRGAEPRRRGQAPPGDLRRARPGRQGGAPQGGPQVAGHPALARRHAGGGVHLDRHPRREGHRLRRRGRLRRRAPGPGRLRRLQGCQEGGHDRLIRRLRRLFGKEAGGAQVRALLVFAGATAVPVAGILR